jgi:ketosteroid isomerase-like protein
MVRVEESRRRAVEETGTGTGGANSPVRFADPITPSPHDPITLDTIERFNAAFNRHDVDAVMALMTEDVIFENTSPPPNGERFVGQAAVRACWERFFADSPQAVFAAEEMVVAADRCVVRWRYAWGDGYIRGVDLFRVRDGKVAEKLSYVKG